MFTYYAITALPRCHFRVPECACVQDYRYHKLEPSSGPPSSTTVTKEEAMRYYSDMSRITGMEKKAKELYRVKAIRGFLHLCLGQVMMIALC